MNNVLSILKSAKGLNTKLDPVRITYKPKKGLQELAVAVNVDIDDTGRISRRKGFTQRIAGSFHSLFCDKETAVCVTGDALSVINEDWTTTPLRNVTVGARMSYCPVDDKIYYTNRYETGYIYNRLSYAWVASSYVGPTSFRVRSDPPIGSFIEHYNGRIYIAQGDTLWYSEPYDHNAFNLHSNFIKFDSAIKMVRAVTSGLFVCSQEKTFFLLGDRVDQGFARVQVAPYAAVEYSDINFNGQLIATEEGEIVVLTNMDDRAALWLTNKGVCYGGPDGRFVNLTMEKIDLPPSLRGCSYIVNDKFIGLIEP